MWSLVGPVPQQLCCSTLYTPASHHSWVLEYEEPELFLNIMSILKQASGHCSAKYTQIVEAKDWSCESKLYKS